MNTDRPVLLVDALNVFCRAYSAYPTMSSHGYQVGGTIGFMKTLKRIVMEIQPKAVYVAWEGGGSLRRRKIFSEYKLSRKPEKLNRFYEDDIPDSEENKKHQIISLLGMLKNTPVCQIYVADCEGDDIIAYLCCGPFKDKNKVIVSSDKDMCQLLNDKTKQYSLHRKMCVTKEDVLEEFRVATHNFAIAKSLCGDSGDNIPGIKGIGFKKVSKLFPVLGTESHLILQDVFDYCHTHHEESKLYERVLQNKKIVERNWKLVYLNGNMIAPSQAQRVDHVLETFEPKVNKMGLIKQLMKEGVTDFDVEDFFFAFNCLEGLSYGAY